MATKTDFTEEEWKALEKGVTGAGMLVSIGDRDLTDSFGEASAPKKALAAQSTSGLVARSPRFGAPASASRPRRKRSRPRRSPRSVPR